MIKIYLLLSGKMEFMKVNENIRGEGRHNIDVEGINEGSIVYNDIRNIPTNYPNISVINLEIQIFKCKPGADQL